MKRQPEVGQPFSQFPYGARIAVIEMCSSREDFYGLESVAGDIGQMLARQPAFVEEMCGDAEAVIRQPPILSWRVRVAMAPEATRDSPTYEWRTRLSQFLQMLRQEFPQSREPGIAHQVGPREGQRPRNVLNVNGVLT